MWGTIGIVAIGAWGLSHLKAAYRERAAKAAFPPEGDFVEVDGTRVHYVTRGTGPDVVLIHGMSGNLRDMTFSLMDRLAERYRVTAFDRPGMGYTARTSKAGETLTEQAHLLAKASAKLGLVEPILMGQSYGGSVALAWGVHNPDHIGGLVLTASPSHPWDGGMSLLYRINSHPLLAHIAIPFESAWVSHRYIDKAIAGVFAPQPMPKGYNAHLGAALTIRRSALRANAMHRAGLLAQIQHLVPLYDQLTMPIEIIHGTADQTVPAEIHTTPLAARLPNAHVTLLDGIGHMPHHCSEDAVLKAVDRVHQRK
ncbi:alpha/beta fold hydrolase [Sagittula sp. SSi028]|uniref:alpha/beta fold hydrolase n=1 Tax=Sagittula sp. SSi028 TaxID=3400636 RepID=UPI003AF68AFB